MSAARSLRLRIENSEHAVRVGSWRIHPSLLPTVAAVAVLGLLIGLGRWQWGRAEEKAVMHGEFALRAADHPIRLPFSSDADAALGGDTAIAMRYTRVRVSGTYDNSHQYLLDNRVHAGVAGYHVLTAMRVDGGSLAVLVNRGWVPVGASRAVLPEIPAPVAPLTVEGLLSPPGTGGLLLGPSGYDEGGWPRVVQRIELERMQDQLGISLYPLVVLLDPEAGAGFVREWRPYYGISPERHRAYAFQWWSLAAALIVIYLVVNVSRAESG